MKIKKINCGDIFEIKGVNNDKLMVTSVNKIDGYYKFTLICGYVIYIPINSGNVEFPLKLERNVPYWGKQHIIGGFHELARAIKIKILNSPFENMRCSKVHYHYLIIDFLDMHQLVSR